MITSEEDRLKIVPYAPRVEASAIPSTGIFESPLRCLEVNEEWASHFIGAMNVLDQWDTWLGTEAEILAALDSIRNAVARFTESGGCEMGHTIGMVFAFAADDPPLGALVCDGGQHLQSAYPELYAVIGDAYGSADSGYFRVPNLAARVPVGAGQISGGTLRELGDIGGSESKVITESNMPEHVHTIVVSSVTVNSGIGTPTSVLTGSGSRNTGSAGFGTSINIMPPFGVVNWCIWAS